MYDRSSIFITNKAHDIVNLIKEVDAGLSELILLERLNLNRNEITIVSGKLVDLVLLRELDLGYNRLDVLPLDFARFKKLKVMDLKGNPLTIPPQSIVERGTEAVLGYLYEASVDQSQTSPRRPRYISSNRPVSVMVMNKRWTRLGSPVDSPMSPMLLPLQEGNTRRVSRLQDMTSPKSMNRHVVILSPGPEGQQISPLVQPADPREGVSVSDYRGLSQVTSLISKLSVYRGIIGDSERQKELGSGLFTLKQLAKSLSGLCEVESNITKALDDRQTDQISTLVQQRNGQRIDAVMFLNNCLSRIETEIQTQLDEQGNRHNNVPDINVDQETWQVKMAALSNQMEKTNQLVTELLRSLNAEIEIWEEHKTLIINGLRRYSNISGAQERGLRGVDITILPNLKLQHYIVSRVSEMTRTLPPDYLTLTIRFLQDITLASGDDAVRQSIFERTKKEMGVEVSSLSLFQTRLEYQIDRASRTDYPELEIIQKDLLGQIRLKHMYPFMRHVFSEYTELIPLVPDRNAWLAKDPYGQSCIVRRWNLGFGAVEKTRNILSTLAGIRHPNIATIRAAWFNDEETLYVEESFYGSQTLRGWIFSSNAVSFAEIQSVFRAILEALHVVHQNGLAWSHLTLDTIAIYSDEFDVLRPVLNGFDFSFDGDDVLPNEAPECHIENRRVRTYATNMFDFASMMIECISVNHAPPELDEQKREFIIPQFEARLNSKFVLDLFMRLVRKSPDPRCHSSFILRHPYFTMDQGMQLTDGLELKTISQPLADLYAEWAAKHRQYQGVLLWEVDTSGDLLDQVLTNIEFTPTRDFYRPLLYTPIDETILDTGQRLNMMELLTQKLLASDLLIILPSGRQQPHHNFVMPNPKAPHKTMFALGRLLLKSILDGTPLQLNFPPAFFKMLLMKPITMTDYETCFPEKCLDMFLEGAEVEEYSSIMRSEIVIPFQAVITEMRMGLCAEPGNALIKISPLDLQSLFHYNVADNLTSDRFRSFVVFDGFDEYEAAIELFWMWIDGLEQTELRTFLLFATSRFFFLAEDMDPKPYRFPPFLVDETERPLLFIHRAQGSSLVRRTLMNHIEIPICSELGQFQRKMLMAMSSWLADEYLAPRALTVEVPPSANSNNNTSQE